MDQCVSLTAGVRDEWGESNSSRIGVLLRSLPLLCLEHGFCLFFGRCFQGTGVLLSTADTCWRMTAVVGRKCSLKSVSMSVEDVVVGAFQITWL